tara:strand:+ start:1364 stop:1759 length:396 start_codon:yes stop_codon:yes gene_type:complete
MDLELKNVSVYSKDLYWILKALVQLEKEFEGEGWFFLKPSDPQKAFDDVVFQLEPKLKDLVDRRGLFYCKQLLYKIDVSESQVARASLLEKDVQFFRVLAKLILSRCLQKVLIRNYFKSNEKESFYKGLES